METVLVRADVRVGEDLEGWLEEPVVALVGALQAALPAGGDGEAPARVAVVVELPGEGDTWSLAAQEALGEAVRGVVGAVTLELGPAARVNTVLTHDAEDAATRAALRFLAGPDAGFVAGATLDVREAT